MVAYMTELVISPVWKRYTHDSITIIEPMQCLREFWTKARAWWYWSYAWMVCASLRFPTPNVLKLHGLSMVKSWLRSSEVPGWGPRVRSTYPVYVQKDMVTYRCLRSHPHVFWFQSIIDLQATREIIVWNIEPPNLSASILMESYVYIYICKSWGLIKFTAKYHQCAVSYV